MHLNTGIFVEPVTIRISYTHILINYASCKFHYLQYVHQYVTILQVKTAGQPEININNDAELLDHAIVQKKLLQSFIRAIYIESVASA